MIVAGLEEELLKLPFVEKVKKSGESPRLELLESCFGKIGGGGLGQQKCFWHWFDSPFAGHPPGGDFQGLICGNEKSFWVGNRKNFCLKDFPRGEGKI